MSEDRDQDTAVVGSLAMLVTCETVGLYGVASQGDTTFIALVLQRAGIKAIRDHGGRLALDAGVVAALPSSTGPRPRRGDTDEGGV